MTTTVPTKPRTALPWERSDHWRRKIARVPRGTYEVFPSESHAGTGHHWMAFLWRGRIQVIGDGCRPLTSDGVPTQADAKRLCEEFEAEQLAIEDKVAARLRARRKPAFKHDY